MNTYILKSKAPFFGRGGVGVGGCKSLISILLHYDGCYDNGSFH